MTDSAFIMGSMGSVVGEKLCRAVEQATDLSLPLVIVSGSGGGARMHEGIISLMQMGKVSAALARFRRARGLFISVLTNPTMGGVAASFASLGDLVFAEPKALIGFAGAVASDCPGNDPDWHGVSDDRKVGPVRSGFSTGQTSRRNDVAVWRDDFKSHRFFQPSRLINERDCLWLIGF